MPDMRAPRSPKDSGGTSPADDLADVWEVLDTLPYAKPATDLTATTVELVAAKVANDAQPEGAPQPRLIDRFVPIAIILAGLVVGLVTGQATAPDPDARILERLPVIEHLGLLQELGSVGFLESLAEQMKGGPVNPPRWLWFVRDPKVLRSEAQEFEATLAALRSEMTAKASSRATIDRRRQRVAELPATDLSSLEKSAGTFEALTPIDRRELERLATVLADPAHAPLHEAAKQWHLIVAASNPAFRRIIIEMPSAERLEWLARSVGRNDQRSNNGAREDDRGGQWRPPEPRFEKPDERNRPGGRSPPFPRPTPLEEGGRPGELPPRGPSVRAPRDPRPASPPAVPSEIQAAPR